MLRLADRWHALPPARRTVLAQLLRYAVTGLAVTILGAAVYWIVATPLRVAPLLANVAAYAVAVAVGYVAHSRISFRGHGNRDDPARNVGRFVIGSGASFALNSLWVWLLTGPLGGPTWWPIVPMLFVTPFAMFALNRLWVFG